MLGCESQVISRKKSLATCAVKQIMSMDLSIETLLAFKSLTEGDWIIEITM